MCTEISHDLRVAQVASRQHGNISRAQLLACGLDDHAIARRVRAGTLHRVYPGVYAVGKPPITPLERASAAVLACGETAALSHASAMTLWGFWKHWDTPFELTVTTDRRPKGIRVHRSTTLGRRDITTQLAIRVTTPARTLFDIAPRLTDRQLKRAVKESFVSHLITGDALSEIIARNPHHPASKRLAPFAAVAIQPANSVPEIDFPGWCKTNGLPTPVMNARVAGYSADAYFPDHGVIVELDSRSYHLNPVSFETDRDRDADTLQAGIVTVRITRDRMTNTSRKEADRLHAILDSHRPPRPNPPG